MPLQEKRQEPSGIPPVYPYNVDCVEDVDVEYSVGPNSIVYQPTTADQATTIQGKFDAFKAQGGE
jgi:hypothetical protein